MAQVPPTPALPLRSGLEEGGEGVEESLLMDQEPDFDDSIFDITFNIEHSRTEMGLDTPKKGETSQSVFQLKQSREERDGESGVVERSERPERRGSSGTPRRIPGRSITPRGDIPRVESSQANTPQANTLRVESSLPGKRNEEDDLECEVASNISHRNEEELLDFGGTMETYTHTDLYKSEPTLDPINESYHEEPHYEPISPVRSLNSPPVREEDIPEESSFLGWGEQPTIADLQLELSLSLSPSLPHHSESSSNSFKRAATSPRQASERKRMKPRSPGRDDYYSRRLSRQSSNGSFTSPSIPSLYLASSSSSSFSQSQSTSRPREISGGGPSRRTTSHVPVYPNPSEPRLEPEPEPLVNDITDLREHPSPAPAPRPTLLARFLAKSTILHPSRSKLSESDRPISPARSFHTPLGSSHPFKTIPLDPDGVDTDPLSPVARADNEPNVSTTPLCSSLAIDSTQGIGDTSNVSHGSRSTTSELGSSLRRSTSQRVLGFFSDLLRTSTPVKSTKAEPAASEPDDRSIDLEAADGNLSVEIESEDEPQKSQDISHSDHESRPSSSSSRYPPLPNYNIPGYRPLTRPNHVPTSHTALRAANPIRQPQLKSKAGSTFTSSALARLPPPGKGASSAGEKITVKPIERATNLLARRALFEVPSNVPLPLPSVSSDTGGMKKTIPLNGKTPGKAAKARAEERRLFDKGVRERVEAKRREREEEEKKRKEEEERVYKEARRGTVVKARPVPMMYRKKA